MKNRLFYFLLCFLLALAMQSCGKMSEDDIKKKTETGVVLVQNSSYFELVMSNGESLYFSSYDEKDGFKDMTGNKDSIKSVTSYGTGFFISGKGEIVTNNHVVAANIKEKDIIRDMNKLFNNLKNSLKQKYSQYSASLNQLSITINQKQYYNEDYAYEYTLAATIVEEMKEMERLYNALDDIDARDSELKYHSEISIAYNDTHVTNTSDFISCVVIKTDVDHDLAIIQLKNKKTPDDKFIFSIEDKDPLEHIAWNETKSKNDKLFMTGYNLGPILAITEEGVKAQFNQGTISQKTDERIMYSIPALPGSSGSPVVNHNGQLVAINYAGLSGTQNFNYGIRVKYLKDLIAK